MNKDWRSVLPGFLISAVALVLIFSFVDFGELWKSLRQAEFPLIAASWLVTLLWLIVRAMAWRVLLSDRPGLTDTFWAVNTGYLLNNLLPFRLGELGRVFLMSRRIGLSFWQVLPSVIIERVFDVAFGVGIFLISFSFVVGGSFALPVALMMAALVVVGFVVLYALARNPEWASAQLDKWGARWPVLLKIGGGILPALLQGLQVLTNTRRFWSVMGLMVVNWLIAIGQYMILLMAFFHQAHPLWATFALGCVSVGVAAPSSPANLGVLEAALVAALGMLRLNHNTALAFAVTMHLLQILLTSLLGAYALTRDGETLGGLYRRLRDLRKP